MLSNELLMYTYDAVLLRAVDGDTADVLIDLGFGIQIKQRIRMAAIDTPERGQPGFGEATAALAQMLSVPFQLRTVKTGKYGRWLAYCWVGGVNVNQWMVDEGLAVPY